MRVSANGGMPEQIVSVESTELAASPKCSLGIGPCSLPLRQGLPEGGIEQWDTARIVVQTLGSGERKTVVERGSHARYLSTGHIVYVLGGVLFAAPFDERRLQVSGRAVPVVDGIMRGDSGTRPRITVCPAAVRSCSSPARFRCRLLCVKSCG